MPVAIIRSTNIHAFRRTPATSTSTSKKSASASSPGAYDSGTKTSRRVRFHSATARFTSVAPTSKPSARSISWRRVAVSRCFPPVQRGDSSSNACSLSDTFASTGFARGAASVRVGADLSR